jgi:hypothetical protein
MSLSFPSAVELEIMARLMAASSRLASILALVSCSITIGKAFFESLFYNPYHFVVIGNIQTHCQQSKASSLVVAFWKIFNKGGMVW